MKTLSLAFSFVVLFVACNKSDNAIPVGEEDTIKFSDNVINDMIADIPVVIYGNKKRRFYSAFQRSDSDGNVINFSRSDLPFPYVLKDNEGNIWSAIGTQKDNNQVKLKDIDFLIGYWFAFPPFNHTIQVFDGPTLTNASFDKKSEDWLIDESFVFSGSVRDGIQSIDQPHIVSIGNKEFLQNEFFQNLAGDQLLSAVQIGNVTHVYPHRLLEYHEIVNDIINGESISLSYCPLTGTTRAWCRTIDGTLSEFGVSGLLYNNNLILYDRQSESFWSQILNKAVFGPIAGTQVETVNVFEITLDDLPHLDGAVKIMTDDTGYTFEYKYPIYVQYPTNDRISFPISFSYEEIHPKERVIGITIDNLTKVYRFNNF